jgi:2-keto-3-deoxy-L-rhamnonate aldolase RhmA
MRVNKAKAKIKTGEKAYGIAFPFKSLPLLEVVGNLGFDYIFLEAEHGFFSLPDIEEMVLMADAKGLTTLARVPNIHPSTILRFLDRGVLGIMGPHIASKEDAEALVSACRFAPRGIRSFFPSKYADYKVPDDVPAYMAKANEEVMVTALLEDASALDDLDSILSIEGLDVSLIGHYDLSQSMGEPGNYEHPRVAKPMADAIEKIRASGVIYGRDSLISTDIIELVRTGAREFLRTS